MGGSPDEHFTGDEIVCMMAASCVGVRTGEEHPLSVDISYKKNVFLLMASILNKYFSAQLHDPPPPPLTDKNFKMR